MSDKPPRPDLPETSREDEAEHLEDVVGALEFLRTDAKRMAASELGAIVEAVLATLQAAYRCMLRGKTGGDPPPGSD